MLLMPFFFLKFFSGEVSPLELIQRPKQELIKRSAPNLPHFMLIGEKDLSMSKLCVYNSDSEIPGSPSNVPKMFENEYIQNIFLFLIWGSVNWQIWNWMHTEVYMTVQDVKLVNILCFCLYFCYKDLQTLSQGVEWLKSDLLQIVD